MNLSDRRAKCVSKMAPTRVYSVWDKHKLIQRDKPLFLYVKHRRAHIYTSREREGKNKRENTHDVICLGKTFFMGPPQWFWYIMEQWCRSEMLITLALCHGKRREKFIYAATVGVYACGWLSSRWGEREDIKFSACHCRRGCRPPITLSIANKQIFRNK
jgi:hypothetical protein